MLLAALALMPISAIAQAADVPGLAAEMSVMENPSGAFSLPDVLAQRDQFAPIRGFHVNPGYTSSTVWVRVAVATGTSQTVLLALSPNFVDFVDVFVPTDRDGSAYEAIALGDHRPLPNDDFSGIENVVVLDLEAGETSEVYIRLQSVNSALSLFAEFYSPGAHTMRNTMASLGFGVWFGGMAILIKPSVTLSCALVDGEVVICVSDEGIGIPQDEVAGVAALSARGSNARHIPGSGTGLSLVSRIVSAHGGSLGLDSRLGEGTTVRIGLPVLAR